MVVNLVYISGVQTVFVLQWIACLQTLKGSTPATKAQPVILTKDPLSSNCNGFSCLTGFTVT